MIRVRAIRLTDRLEIVVKCVHSVVSDDGHVLAHVLAELPNGGGTEPLEVLADLLSSLYARAEAGELDWTDDCGW